MFDAGIAVEQLWLTRSGGELNLRIVGSNDQLNLLDWFGDESSRVDQIETAAGDLLENAEVQALVDAMAAFDPPMGSDPDLPRAILDSLQADIAAAWNS